MYEFPQEEGDPETAIAKMIRSIAQNVDFKHPILNGKGWWLRNERVLFDRLGLSETEVDIGVVYPNPIIILGATGILGQAFARVCLKRNISYIILNRQEVDLINRSQIEKAILKYKPWAIINATGYVSLR